MQPGTNLVANPLLTTNWTISALLPNCPEGSKIYKNNGSSSEYRHGAWDLPALGLYPGEGIVFVNPSSTFEVVFAGELPYGSLTINIPPGLSLISSKAPITGLLEFPAKDGNLIYTWDDASQTLTMHEFWGDFWWEIPPTTYPGQAFWVLVFEPTNWVQNCDWHTGCGGGAGIYRQPRSRTNYAGTTAVFAVGATSFSPLTYRWRFNGTDLTDGARISGVTTSTLTVSNVVESDAGGYSVAISGSGSSSVATLTVLPSDSDGDGLPAVWELANGLDPANPADAQGDMDGDGMSNFDEFVAGTNPRDASSCLRLHIAKAGGNIVLTWPAVPGPLTLQSANSLESGVWQVVASATSPYTSVYMPGETAQRFFRLASLGTGTTVYSVNVVGYINQSIPPGPSVISNPVDKLWWAGCFCCEVQPRRRTTMGAAGRGNQHRLGLCPGSWYRLSREYLRYWWLSGDG